MNGLHGIKLANDFAALKNAQVSYSPSRRQLVRGGQPLNSWVFANRPEAVKFAKKHGATVVP